MSKDTFKCSCGNWEYRGNETFTSSDPNSWPICRQCADEYFEQLEEKATEAKVLYDKYTVSKTNGLPLDKGAKYFVLRYDRNSFDKTAREVLLSYAAQKEMGELIADIAYEINAIGNRRKEAAKNTADKFRPQDEK